MVFNLKRVAVLLLTAGTSLAAEPVITCEPRELRGVTGEPLRLEISVETDHAVPIQLKIPHINLLHLNTVEKVPIQRAASGRYIQKRTIFWQGLESGQTTITNLTVLFQGSENSSQEVPDIEIIIEEVKAAEPPIEAQEEE